MKPPEPHDVNAVPPSPLILADHGGGFASNQTLKLASITATPDPRWPSKVRWSMVTPPPESASKLGEVVFSGKSNLVPIAVDDSLPPSCAKKQSPSTIPPSSPSPALKDSSNGSLIEANSLSVPSSSMASSPRAPIVPLKQAAEASQPGESNIIDRRLKEKDCSELDLLTPPAAVGMVSSPPLTIAAEIPTSSLLLGKGAWSIPINIISKEKMQSPSVDLFNQENWPTLKDSQNGDLKKRQGFVGLKANLSRKQLREEHMGAYTPIAHNHQNFHLDPLNPGSLGRDDGNDVDEETSSYLTRGGRSIKPTQKIQDMGWTKVGGRGRGRRGRGNKNH
ncbi:hypothetical protein Bca101_023461 [Brassica carinata]